MTVRGRWTTDRRAAAGGNRRTPIHHCHVASGACGCIAAGAQTFTPSLNLQPAPHPPDTLPVVPPPQPAPAPAPAPSVPAPAPVASHVARWAPPPRASAPTSSSFLRPALRPSGRCAASARCNHQQHRWAPTCIRQVSGPALPRTPCVTARMPTIGALWQLAGSFIDPRRPPPLHVCCSCSVFVSLSVSSTAATSALCFAARSRVPFKTSGCRAVPAGGQDFLQLGSACMRTGIWAAALPLCQWTPVAGWAATLPTDTRASEVDA